MYDDDTALYCNMNCDISDQDINAELKKVSNWLCSNKLSVNVKQTKYRRLNLFGLFTNSTRHICLVARAGLELVTMRSQSRRFPSTPHMSTK